MDKPRALPAALSRMVQADLEPVRPLRAPWRRAVWLLPLGLLLLLGVPAVFGLRDDAPKLGPFALWGASAFEMLAGLMLAGLALREAVPARQLTRTMLTGAALLGLAVVLGVTVLTDELSHGLLSPRVWLSYCKFCFHWMVLLGLPPLVVAGWLAARALPLRPAVTGVLCGAAAGLLCDAAWRMYCYVSDPSHVLFAHSTAILALALLGAFGAVLGTRLQQRYERAT